MYDVLILEDNIEELKEIESVVQNIDENISIYSTGYSQDALEVAEENNIKLFLIDIDLPDFSGLTFTEYIRQMDRHKLTNIIFISSVDNDKLSIFKNFHCYDYVLKPYDKEYLKELLENIIHYGFNEREKKYIVIEYKSFSSRIPVEDIIYIERISRKLHIITKEDEYVISNRTLSSLLEELGDGFIQPYRSIILNIDFISSVDFAGNTIHLKNITEAIPIGRMYKNKLKDMMRCK